MIKNFDLKSVPRTPGVYRLLDGSNTILYVGKAKNLSSRISYYLQVGIFVGKTEQLVKDAEKIEWTQTDSEIESLILEASLIKKLRPKYNVSGKDDKSYDYLLITKVNRYSPDGSYPLVSLVRRRISGLGQYFGPFPQGYSVRLILRGLRRIFPFRDCNQSKFLNFLRRGRGCLLSDLKLCNAPCVIGRISVDDYLENIKMLRFFFLGKVGKYAELLEKGMEAEAEKLNFEKALEYRKTIEKINLVIRKQIPAESYLTNPNLYSDLRREELISLEEFLKPYFLRINLHKGFCRIESYDISHLGQGSAVGALVTFVNGVPEKKSYRRYRIRGVANVNDVAMMAEIIRRRMKNKEMPIPDLVLVDGGKAQLNAATKILNSFQIPCIALAKRWERIVVADRYVRVPKDRPLLKLLMRLRDETHRFALDYQKKVRRLYPSAIR